MEERRVGILFQSWWYVDRISFELSLAGFGIDALCFLSIAICSPHKTESKEKCEYSFYIFIANGFLYFQSE